MSEELAREIEAGGGTDEAVALALGWVRTPMPWATKKVLWTHPGQPVPTNEAPWGSDRPAFLTDLNALAAECERRGWSWQVHWHADLVRKAWGIVSTDPDGDGYRTTAPTPARALAAALVRAAGASA